MSLLGLFDARRVSRRGFLASLPCFALLLRLLRQPGAQEIDVAQLYFAAAAQQPVTVISCRDMRVPLDLPDTYWKDE